MEFVSEHPRLGPAALLALLSAYLLDSGYLRRHLPGLFPFNLVEQYTPGNKPIESLLTSCLALHLQAGWPMEQHHARRRFIDVLTPCPPDLTKVSSISDSRTPKAAIRWASCCDFSGLTGNAVIAPV